jgi:hypothetical protein
MPRAKNPPDIEHLLIRVPTNKVREIDTWAKRQEGLISRPEAVRRLVDVALKTEKAR